MFMFIMGMISRVLVFLEFIWVSNGMENMAGFSLPQRMSVLQGKLANIDLKYDQSGVLLSSLMEERSRQADHVGKIEKQTGVLQGKLEQLEKQFAIHLKKHAAEPLHTETTSVFRYRRQANSTHEGPVAFMSSLNYYCKYNIAAKQDLIFSTVDTNLGHAYNPASGVFTAPRAGVYLFSSSIVADTLANSEIVHVAMLKNGHVVAKILAASEAFKHKDQGSSTVIVELQQGDNVWLRNVDNNGVSICGMNGLSTFSGYLLYPY